ncbi:MAG: Gfo/Idh/MocA family oxidoreductase [Candidatus Melainabacteria bacterium]|nr:Gfo/Idh/MocA family oxidoreductase [Candidatus Melainabacteria bacterium]
MRQVKWGVLGGSGFARRRSIPAMMQCPNVELVGVASRSQEKSEKFKEQFSLAKVYSSYQELLDDVEIEAVHIPLPNSMHSEWALAALEKGKHVLSEKPFATTVEDAQLVAEKAEQTGLKVMEALMWPFHPQHRTAKKLVADGVIGEVRFIRASFTYMMTAKSGIRLDKELGGGSLLDVGCYPVSGARYYFDEEPISVFASGDIHPEHGVDTNASAILQFAKGRAVIDFGFHLPYRTEMEIVGELGHILFPRAWQPFEQSTIYLNDDEIVLPPANHYINLFEHFSQCVLDDTTPEIGVDDAVNQMKALDAIKKSLVSGSAQKL